MAVEANEYNEALTSLRRAAALLTDSENKKRVFEVRLPQDQPTETVASLRAAISKCEEG